MIFWKGNFLDVSAPKILSRNPVFTPTSLKCELRIVNCEIASPMTFAAACTATGCCEVNEGCNGLGCGKRFYRVCTSPESTTRAIPICADIIGRDTAEGIGDRMNGTVSSCPLKTMSSVVSSTRSFSMALRTAGVDFERVHMHFEDLLSQRTLFFEVSVELLTGRTHQVRAQCASLGAPIFGDTLYYPLCGFTLPNPMDAAAKVDLAGSNLCTQSLEHLRSILELCKDSQLPLGLQANELHICFNKDCKQSDAPDSVVVVRAPLPWW
eukprot:Lankesteria_metandrocarpae@DN2840_c0_g1_i1.p1